MFQSVDSSFNPANVTTSVSSEPKELVLNVKGLTVSAVARVSYGVDAVGEGLWVVVVNSGGRWNSVASHKRISTTDKLIIG